MRDFSRHELVLLWALTSLLFVSVVLHFLPYLQKVDNFGDNGAYIGAASAVRHWDFHGVQVKQFWGLSYVIALVSSISGLSGRTAMLLVCAVSSLTSVVLVSELWGGWIAGFFSVLTAFLAMRRERWVWASIFASFASVVRPVGVLVLVALGVTLLWKRNFKRFALCTGVGLTIGLLYVLPFWIYFHDPLYQVHRYRTADWQSGPAVGIPFYAIVIGIVHNTEPWTNLLLTVGWVVFALVGTVAMLRKGLRTHFREHPAECLFAFLYAAFLFTYNSIQWARSDFPRFAVPLLPFMLLGLHEWLPKSRVALFAVGATFAVLAAFSAVGIRNVFPALP